jgi:hypothetical protein
MGTAVVGRKKAAGAGTAPAFGTAGVAAPHGSRRGGDAAARAGKN